MNKTFTLVWSAVRGAYIVTHEHAKRCGKPSSTRTGLGATGLVLGLMGALGSNGLAWAAPPTPPVPAVNALPTGAQVAAGAASITQSATRMDINQSTQKAILNWQSFNIGANAQVNFAQPNASAVALNRVLSSDPSAIYGKLSANGQVFLLNPNGVLFGAGARADVGGLVASTMSLGDADFMAGSYKFSSGSRSVGGASVLNQGTISAAQGGYVALLSPEVRNEGVISASLGTVVLGGAEAVTLSHDSSGLSYAVDKGAVQALVDNKGLVQAEGGQVILSARAANSLASAVINNSGTIEAKGLTAKGGRIVLEADSITLQSGSTLDASGTTGGGTVLVGGDWQGSGTLHQATTVTMEQGAKINVSATHSGSGGKAVLWSDITQDGSVTRVDGEILAKGGSASGNIENAGGRIETSGHKLTIGDNASVNTSGASGAPSGLWLLDPFNFTIGTGGDITGAALTTALETGAGQTVSISTHVTSGLTAPAYYGASGSGGDIIINDSFGWSKGTLALDANRSVLVNNAVNVSGTGGLTVRTNLGNYTDAMGNGTSTGTRAGYLKFKQNRNGLTGTDTFDGTLNWTSSGALSINSAAYTIVSAVSGTAGTDLVELANGSGNYALAGNLDLNSVAWTPMDFSGKLEGLGHTISNLSVTGLEGQQEQAGFIRNATSGTVLQNIGLVNAQIVGKGDAGTGAFIGRNNLTGGTIILRNLFVDATSTVTNGSTSARNSFGGFVGEGMRNASTLGWGTFTVVDGYNAAKLYSATTSISYAGGIVGNISPDSNPGRPIYVTLMDVYNVGEIVGGTLASKNGGNFDGGLIGSLEMQAPGGSVQLENLRNYGAVFSGSYVGGVGGQISSRGSPAVYGPVDAYLITNYGAISGDGSNGGIFGTAAASASGDSGTTRNIILRDALNNRPPIEVAV
ncbi:MAG: filamentous hemagglutinin N-terminal domain-containing protein [Burkholderiales bacterium]|nr:filamentous hemagglutinin N-terminal domain-containing protein [Burkholderiales bacterium]